MPYPPTKNDTKSSYMKRCVKLMKKEGASASKARDTCYAIWLQSRKKRKK